MKITSKSQATIKNMEKNDGVVAYSIESKGAQSIANTRIVDGKREYIKQCFNGQEWSVKKFTSLSALRKALTINHF